MKPEVGDRVRLTAPLLWGGSKPGVADPCSPPVGSEGVVTWVNTWTDQFTQQFSVKWDDGVHGPPHLLGSDPYELLPDGGGQVLCW